MSVVQGRGAEKNEEQPHARQIADAPESAMRSPDPDAKFLPVSGDDKRSMPDARRDVDRCAQGEPERVQARTLHRGGDPAAPRGGGSAARDKGVGGGVPVVPHTRP